jgi:hypothetical protein
VDKYTPAKGGSVTVDRVITINKAGSGDAGYRPEFVVRTSAAKLDQVEIFVPGVWYCDSGNVPNSSVITDQEAAEYLFREDRLPVPMIAVRRKDTGLTVSLTHLAPDGRTILADYNQQTLTDSRLMTGSIGLLKSENLELLFALPGNETHTGGRATTQRYHPVKANATQTIKLMVKLSIEKDFAAAMRDSWRSAFDRIDVPIVKAPVERICRDGIALLDFYCKPTNGVMGFPFAVSLPDGKVVEVSYQSGFVGMQIPGAAELLAYGLTNKNPQMIGKAETMLHFWATQSLSPQGVPRTWYNAEGGEQGWRRYDTYLRIASDGAIGMLDAWAIAKRAGRYHPLWKHFCVANGDWLLRAQNADGTFARSFSFDGTPVEKSKTNTLHPVRFLVELSLATGEKKYLDAAIRAGNAGLDMIGSSAAYVGGTPDNPNVKDKEAGWLALVATLALYDATGDRQWLDAAVAAASYTESWMYTWNVPAVAEDKRDDFPKKVSTIGGSLIATGPSSADMLLAVAPFDYYRVYLLTGDAHFLKVARVLMNDTKQSTDVGGNHGYAHPGLLTEATSFAIPRRHGVNVWLPWETVMMIDPLWRFQEAFGSMDIERIEQLTLDERKRRNEACGKTHGVVVQ